MAPCKEGAVTPWTGGPIPVCFVVIRSPRRGSSEQRSELSFEITGISSTVFPKEIIDQDQRSDSLLKNPGLPPHQAKSVPVRDPGGDTGNFVSQFSSARNPASFHWLVRRRKKR